MSYYSPLYIKHFESGLTQSRQNFLLPDDAYPVLQNMFVWRERLKRKSGYELLGRLRRLLEAEDLGNLDGNGDGTFNIRTILSLESNADIEPDSIVLSDGVNDYTDDGEGVITGVPGGSGTINYQTMVLTITGGDPSATLLASFSYHPNLPVMGIRQRELNSINVEQMLVFDQVYAYIFNAGFQEFIPGTTWSGNDSDFFWSTNYWVGTGNQKIFWVTNFSGISGDPIRYTNGTAWADFTPEIDSAGNVLAQCLAMLPFRGRMVTVNTFEGSSLATATQFRQRIRWSQIGNPFYESNAIVTDFNVEAWRDDIPGRGGFLDIPTAENIVSIGFVRDNLVVFCERSTWQLRYTGRSIAPFAIEKINTELGAESTFSAIPFDTSLVAVGDKGIVQCDSFKVDLIDIKIPDLVFRFNNDANGTKRVHGARDFQQRLAFWTYPDQETGSVYPNRRLVYNYENDSWAIFAESFTTMGTYQPQEAKRWVDFPGPNPDDQWQAQNYPWINRPSAFPTIAGGNQQGFVEIFGQQNFKVSVPNGASLYIKNITGNVTTPTEIESPSHNLDDEAIIEITGIPEGTPFDDLNQKIFKILRIDANNFSLLVYSEITNKFSDPQLNPNETYVGGGRIIIRDNFLVQSKKFNFMDDGQAIQFGHMDILMNNTDNGEITLNVYADYNDTEPMNTFPQNDYNNTEDPYFNTIISTSATPHRGSSKNFQRFYCNARASFITLEFTLSDEQMQSQAQGEDVQIDSQVLYMRPAGRQLTPF